MPVIDQKLENQFIFCVVFIIYYVIILIIIVQIANYFNNVNFLTKRCKFWEIPICI